MSRDAKDSIASYLSRVINPDTAKLPKNRVKVRIAGEDFTIVAPESDEYIRRVASYVDSKIAEISVSAKIPLIDATILAACNIADEQFKSSDAAESMRLQLKSYVDDIARLRAELAEARREITRLQNK